METDCLKQESKAAITAVESAQHTIAKNLACYKQLEKQKKFLTSKSKDIVCRSLRMLDKLEEVEEREK